MEMKQMFDASKRRKMKQVKSKWEKYNTYTGKADSNSNVSTKYIESNYTKHPNPKADNVKSKHIGFKSSNL